MRWDEQCVTTEPALPVASEDWVQFNIAPSRGDAGRVSARPLLDGLTHRLAQWRESGEVLCWFIRKPPGLRLRLGGGGFGAGARADLRSLLDHERERRRIEGWHQGRYEPELHRLGGATMLPTVHALFSADTDVWLAWCALRDRGGNKLSAQWMSLASYGDLVLQGTEATEEAWDVWAELHRVYAGTPPQAPSPDLGSNRLGSAGLQSLASPQEAQLIGDAVATNARFVTVMRQHAEGGGLVGGPRSLLATLACFYWNRWGVASEACATLCAAMSQDLHPYLAFESLLPDASA